MEKDDTPCILFMGTYPPRECGIATFTRDLALSIDKEFNPILKSRILSINKTQSVYNYPKEVMFQINEGDINDYIDIAKKINQTDSIKLINIQHEFGIFGGEYGNYLIPFLELVKKPVVVTFHSVLPHPNDKMKKIVQLIAQQSLSIIVMTKKAIEILRNDYGIKSKITLIPHGIPSVEFNINKNEKNELGYKDKILLSSFGLMNKGKGYEYVIESLPEVVKKFPNLLYLIIGQTHPVVRKQEGERYRNLLERKIKELGLEKNVKFYDKYLTLDEILKYLKASDIYICASLDPHQITSGTLVYAMGSGRSVISTPFLHAKDIIHSDRGILLNKFRDSNEFKNALLKILSEPESMREYEKNSYSYTRHMIWSNIALSYKEKFKEIIDFSEPDKLPEINLDHLMNLTDDKGIIQFAEHTKPDLEFGYSVDDNARALIAICMHNNLEESKPRMSLVKTYFNYIERVFDNGRFFNFIDKHNFIDKKNFSEDAHGRALWALGYLISHNNIPEELRQRAVKLFKDSMAFSMNIKSPRAVAFIILGLYFYNKTYPDVKNILKIKKLSDHLVALYHHNKSSDWKWFEKYLTYSNSKILEALFYSFIVTGDSKYLDIAKNALDFLISLTFEKGQFCAIGQSGWHIKGKQRAYFDQQPVDTSAMVQTLTIASHVLENPDYLKKAKIAFNWFLGKNHLNQMIYDETTGGCFDGLGKYGINLNQGAESTVSYLLARLALEPKFKNCEHLI